MDQDERSTRVKSGASLRSASSVLSQRPDPPCSEEPHPGAATARSSVNARAARATLPKGDMKRFRSAAFIPVPFMMREPGRRSAQNVSDHKPVVYDVAARENEKQAAEASHDRHKAAEPPVDPLLE